MEKGKRAVIGMKDEGVGSRDEPGCMTGEEVGTSEERGERRVDGRGRLE